MKDLCEKCSIDHRPRAGCGGSLKHDPHCDCGICAYCNGEEDVYGNSTKPKVQDREAMR